MFVWRKSTGEAILGLRQKLEGKCHVIIKTSEFLTYIFCYFPFKRIISLFIKIILFVKTLFYYYNSHSGIVIRVGQGFGRPRFRQAVP